MRHADLILLVGDADGDPARRDWERGLARCRRAARWRGGRCCSARWRPATLSGTRPGWRRGTLDFHLHLRAGVPADFERLARMLAGKALGLVLGGGAARGFAHLGVYRALSEAAIAVDWIGGASIGAVMGAAIAQGRRPWMRSGGARPPSSTASRSAT